MESLAAFLSELYAVFSFFFSLAEAAVDLNSLLKL